MNKKQQHVLPGFKDEGVLFAILQLTRMADKTGSPKFWFNKQQFFAILGLVNRHFADERLKESLFRWRRYQFVTAMLTEKLLNKNYE